MEVNDKTAEAPAIRLTLVVEYESAIDAIDSAKELIEQARGYGRPVAARLSGIPTEMDLDP